MDEVGAEQIASSLADIQEQESAGKGERKETREKLLSWMLENDKLEFNLGKAQVKIKESNEPLKVLDVVCQTLKEDPYNWNETQIDDFCQRFKETKDQLTTTKPVLHVKVAKKRKKTTIKDYSNQLKKSKNISSSSSSSSLSSSSTPEDFFAKSTKNHHLDLNDTKSYHNDRTNNDRNDHETHQSQPKEESKQQSKDESNENILNDHNNNQDDVENNGEHNHVNRKGGFQASASRFNV